MKKIILIAFLGLAMACYAQQEFSFQTGEDFALPRAGVIHPHINFTSGTDVPIAKISEIYKVDANTVKVVIKMNSLSSTYTYYWSLNEVVPFYKREHATGAKLLLLTKPYIGSSEPEYFMKITSVNNNKITVVHGANNAL